LVSPGRQVFIRTNVHAASANCGGAVKGLAQIRVAASSKAALLRHRGSRPAAAGGGSSGWFARFVLAFR